MSLPIGSSIGLCPFAIVIYKKGATGFSDISSFDSVFTKRVPWACVRTVQNKDTEIQLDTMQESMMHPKNAIHRGIAA